MVLQRLKATINHNVLSGNTPQALIVAFLAFIAFFAITFTITLLFQSTAFLQGTIDPSNPVQSIMRHGFAATGLSEEKPIFANSILLTYIAFGFVISIIETSYIIRFLEWLARSFGISLAKFSIGLLLIYFVIGYAFVLFHANVKGVEDNTALTMTFIFAIMSLEIARRFKEMEPALYLHIINNVFFIFNIIGFG